MNASLIDSLFSWAVARRAKIIDWFKVLYAICAFLFLLGCYLLFQGTSLAPILYQVGLKAADVAIILFIVTLIPGIANRFGIKHKLIALLRVFRRYIGISMYCFVLIHLFFVRGVTLIKTQVLSFQLFELCGLAAFFFLFFLFITSNDVSLARLGIWWYRLHRITYFVMWLILFHVALQSISLWTVLIGATVILMMASFIYKYRQSSQVKPKVTDR